MYNVMFLYHFQIWHDIRKTFLKQMLETKLTCSNEHHCKVIVFGQLLEFSFQISGF